mmetsp:Transcript_17939/g.53751  ORF Transcript_17939/g.53751 Transcript_17939/m.53751 type:complete len:98 (-) Transcript_17939:135-428(-)
MLGGLAAGAWEGMAPATFMWCSIATWCPPCMRPRPLLPYIHRVAAARMRCATYDGSRLQRVHNHVSWRAHHHVTWRARTPPCDVMTPLIDHSCISCL